MSFFFCIFILLKNVFVAEKQYEYYKCGERELCTVKNERGKKTKPMPNYTRVI